MRRGLLLLGWGLLAIGGLQASPPASLAQSAATAPSLPMMTLETLRNFDPTALMLAWNNRRWQLVHRNEVLKDFGSREQEARQALRLIQELGMNQYGTIGAPYPVMEYWLVNGQAPRAVAPAGMRALELEPATLRVQQMHGQWCLCSAGRVLFSFGANGEEAREALAVVQKYGFSQIGVIGQAAPSMYVFFRRPADGQSDAAPVRVGNGSSRSMATPKFSRIAKNPDGSPHIQQSAQENGLEGIVAPVVPPLVRNGALPPGAPEAQPSTPLRQTTFWREQPHFGRSTAAVQPDAERTPFDWRQVQVRQDGGDWKLMAGSLVLANFGFNVQDARTALSALHYYRFTERMHAGDAQHPVNYYLVNGQSPRGVMIGLPAESFDPEKLAAQKAEGGCSLMIGARVLVRLGERPEEARKLLEEIKRNKIDRLCTMGEPGKEAMTFLLRSR